MIKNYYETQQFTHHRKKKYMQLRPRDQHQVLVNVRPCSRYAAENLRLGQPSTLNRRVYGA